MNDPDHVAESLLDRMELNNYLQARWGGLASLTWQRHRSGPEHSTSWEVIAFCTYQVIRLNTFNNWTLIVVAK
jgi:hypothetical protein